MNYPLWDLPSAGLLIAFIAVVHVFISHFAVGGGLFLVLTERKARRDQDAALLEYVERHSRFFVLLTLVGGAITGVGIWFTIGLVHPAATASLISAFVWGWAIEWTFFVVEIAAAMVYYYGWRRLPAALHLRIGWIYFGAAWLSLAVINAVLAFMLTPGAWLTTGSFWDGVLNPTYLPSLVVRTSAAIGLAGLYAVFTASWLADAELKARIARYATLHWVLPMAIIIPAAIAWYLSAAHAAGVAIPEILGEKTHSLAAVLRAAFSGSPTGYPFAQRALTAMVIASGLLLLLAAALVARRSRSYGRAYAALMMLCGFVALGGAEWLREDLRKPYVIGNYMFVTGVRAVGGDRFSAEAIARRGVLASALWARQTPSGDGIEEQAARGRELFRLSCSACHTVDGYLGMRPLVRGTSVAAAAGTIGRLSGWRNRHMPGFPGTAEERHALAVYLATIGGMTPAAIAAASATAALGARVFEENCSPCHGPTADIPFDAKGRAADELFDMIARLPQINDAMPRFEGNDAERRALAEHLATLPGAPQALGGVR